MNKFKTMVALGSTVAMLGTSSLLFPGEAFAATTNTNISNAKAMSLSQYESYLSQLNTPQAKNTLTRFEALSNSQKTEFLNLLSNKTAIQNALSGKSVSGVKLVSTKVSNQATPNTAISPNTVVSSGGGGSPVTGTFRDSNYFTLSILSIPITQYYENVVFYTSNNVIQRIDTSEAIVNYNYDPTVQTYLESDEVYIGNNTVYQYATFSYGIGIYKGLSAQYGTVHVNQADNFDGSQAWIQNYTG